MAIGLGKMFGFTFPENFNYPYIASSITDFWRRWHMTLSSWFRDYLYIPLGGNRVPKWRAVSESAHRVFPLRALAWSDLDICRLGAFPWRIPDHRTRGTTQLAPAAEDSPACLSAAGRDDWMGFLPGQHIYRGGAIAAADGIPRRQRVRVLHNDTVRGPDSGNRIGRRLVGKHAAGIVDGNRDRPRRRHGGRGRLWLVDLTAGVGEFAVMVAIFIASTALSAAGTYNPFIYFRF